MPCVIHDVLCVVLPFLNWQALTRIPPSQLPECQSLPQSRKANDDLYSAPIIVHDVAQWPKHPTPAANIQLCWCCTAVTCGIRLVHDTWAWSILDVAIEMGDNQGPILPHAIPRFCRSFYWTNIPDEQKHDCPYLYHIIFNRITLNVTGIIIAEVILAIRTWALWRRSKRVGIVLVVLAVSAIVPAYVICWEWMRRGHLVYAINPAVGCTQTDGSPIIAVDFILIVLWESAVLGLTLFSGLPSFRVNRGRSLLSVLYRDGVLFYIYLLAFSIVNITVVITAPRLLAGILTSMQRAVHSSLSARVILNLREVERRELDYSLAINSMPLRDIKSRFEVRFARSDPSTLASSSSGGEIEMTVTQWINGVYDVKYVLIAIDP